MAGGGDVEYQFYEQFFFARDLEPYPVQERAFEHIFRGESVLVTVPTGTGKTLIAKAAIHKALASGQRAVYTTPLRALTEEKYRELCADFGDERVGFATGDYKVRPEAPVQVVVAEILWNRIYAERAGARQAAAPGAAGAGGAVGPSPSGGAGLAGGGAAGRPIDVVIMDEGHYFNDPERGHIWEQSIIGMDPRTQLVILSATIGEAQQFCNWVYSCRRVEMHLVQSFDRKVPLEHQFRESYLIDVVKELFHAGEVPAIIFCFGREQCFENARLLKSCSRFTSDAERDAIAARAQPLLHDRGIARELKPLLLHGIGVHHAGILPRYKQLVEELTLGRLLKFVVSTETISAGINLPAKRVIFPSLRKHIQGKARLLTSAEYHQMSGRAGRPQFDTEGVAIALAPEEVVQEIRKELKDAARGHLAVDEARVRKAVYAHARSEAQRHNEVIWDGDTQQALVAGKPAPLRSQTRISAEQILAIGLPDLTREPLADPEAEAAAAASEAALPASLHLDIRTVIAHLNLPDRERVAALRRLAQVTENLAALGVIDERGVQVKGFLINQLRGIDGLFVHYCLISKDLLPEEQRALVEFLVDHNVIQRILDRKEEDAKREWMRNRLRERRREEPQLSWEDVEQEYLDTHPRELTLVEQLHREFLGLVPHPELHGGKTRKNVWATMEDAGLGFMDLVERENLAHEEGSLFSYLLRVMKFARMLREVTGVDGFAAIEDGVRRCLAVVDERVVGELG